MNRCSICLRDYDFHASSVRDVFCCDDCSALVAAARARGETVWKYGSFESHPAVYDDDDGRAFVLFVRADGWRKMPYGEVFNKVGMMTKADFDACYGELPPIPTR